MRSSPWLLPPTPLSLHSIPLGSLIPSIQHPHQDAFTPISISLQPPDPLIYVHTQTDFSTHLSSARSSRLSTHLTRLLSISNDRAKSSSLDLASVESRTYELRNPEQHLAEVCKTAEARRWLQRRVERGGKSYVVIGLRTFTDARVRRHKQSTVGLDGEVSVPTADVVTASLGAPLLGSLVGGDLLDVGVGAGKSKSEGQGEAYLAPGEQIYALCYREIAFKWFEKKAVDNAFLKEANRWVMMDDNRSTGKEDDEEVVEVVFRKEDVGSAGGEGEDEEEGLEMETIKDADGDEETFVYLEALDQLVE